MVYKKGLKPIVRREFMMIDKFTTVEKIAEKTVWIDNQL